MKKVLNSTDQVVEEMLDGFVTAHADSVKRIPDTTVIARKDAPVSGKVGLVSGGGSGHEPAHGGYVGKGMLDAAVVGEVFTSPTPDQVLEGIKATDSGSGVLLIIKNYTGDVMNFDMAAELAEAEGITVEKVIVNDDVAVEDSTFTTGRRGIAGTVFVHKIAGAIAESGASLAEVKAAAEKVIKNVRSMGVALESCTVPAAGKPSFTLKEDEVEIGIGIHGEPGIERVPLQSANEITSTLVAKILADIDYTNSEVAVLVNGMGATPEMELFIVHRQVAKMLGEKGINIYKTWVGEYMTSLEMTGFSISLLKLDDQLKEALDGQSDAIAFRL
ncbi:dihydroxyacetone kinase, N-terminal domain [Gracilibacillus orientalis]|uniref:Dihydroxyacetone kinase, N-terminal domain n=1 Tax=Gracilibacillus orientalis TaxID=334253 RepID=A0A1I4IER3_9BACI|nr:dihydroxyacetone kinase subunit DhaK [Gracilibacillus orientalis]SFL52795.1 dihydroxyacetone kinase, N-terminal domain [Gracilibacillus orientalis]